LANKLKEKEAAVEAAKQEIKAEEPEEMVYVDREEEFQEDDGDEMYARDEVSVATADVERLSVAPTE